MAKKFKFTRLKKLENYLVSIGIRRGFTPKGMHILRVKGRISGEYRQNPVDPIVVDGKRYLVGPFGVVTGLRTCGWRAKHGFRALVQPSISNFKK